MLQIDPGTGPQPGTQLVRTRRGVQQPDVDAAADAILARGERPTIERVRQVLGTGSPNTVTPLLDNWYRKLGRRLSGGPAQEAPGRIPGEILEAATRLWDAARDQARRELMAELAAQRDELAAARSALEAERARTQEEAKVLAATRASLEEGLRLAHVQVAELRKAADERSELLAREQARGREFQAALEAARSELKEAHATAQGQIADQARLHAAERVREAERSAAAQRHQLQELDRSRQETARAEKELQAALGKRREAEARLEEGKVRQEQLQAEASSLQLQLAQARAELQGFRELAEAAQKMADASAARASELAAHLAAGRWREEDPLRRLRGRSSRGGRLGHQR